MSFSCTEVLNSNSVAFLAAVMQTLHNSICILDGQKTKIGQCTCTSSKRLDINLLKNEKWSHWPSQELVVLFAIYYFEIFWHKFGVSWHFAVSRYVTSYLQFYILQSSRTSYLIFMNQNRNEHLEFLLSAIWFCWSENKNRIKHTQKIDMQNALKNKGFVLLGQNAHLFCAK